MRGCPTNGRTKSASGKLRPNQIRPRLVYDHHAVGWVEDSSARASGSLLTTSSEVSALNSSHAPAVVGGTFLPLCALAPMAIDLRFLFGESFKRLAHSAAAASCRSKSN